MKLALPLLALLALAACKPPPSDEATTGRIFTGEPDAPPKPLTSPDSEGAIWTMSEERGRIIYGQVGAAPLMAMRCLGGAQDARLQMTRLSPADENGQAFFALVGNSHTLRFAVDAAEVPGGYVWQGVIAADDPDIATLTGPGEVTATLPGAGMVTLYPSAVMKQLVADCRALMLPKPSFDILGDDEGAIAADDSETSESAQPAL